MATSSSHGTARRPHLPPLIPPFRFACVEDGIYRGACPSLRNLRYLTRLNLRALISLLPHSSLSVLDPDGNGNGNSTTNNNSGAEYVVPDAPVKDLREFCDQTHIHHYTHVLDKYDDGFSHTEELVARVLGQLLDKDNHPVFIHCMDGRNNTGLIIMCLRKLQNWNDQAILDEFARYTKDNNFEYNEHIFVKNFDHPITAPTSVPDWFLSRIKPSLNITSNSSQAKSNANSSTNLPNPRATPPPSSPAGVATPFNDPPTATMRITSTPSSRTPN